VLEATLGLTKTLESLTLSRAPLDTLQCHESNVVTLAP
jgi:hypothetical protein